MNGLKSQNLDVPTRAVCNAGGMSGAQLVQRGSAQSCGLGHLTVDLFADHEGGPWLEIKFGKALLADTPVVPGLSTALRGLADAIDAAALPASREGAS